MSGPTGASSADVDQILLAGQGYEGPHACRASAASKLEAVHASGSSAAVQHGSAGSFS